MRALAALKRPVNYWDDMLIYLIASKLDYYLIKEWEKSLESRQLPTFNKLVEFLARRCEMLEAVARRSTSIELNSESRQAYGKTTTAHAAMMSVKCVICKGDHQVYQCKTFIELSIADRTNKVKFARLCLNCLKGKHMAKECTANGCRKCSKKHSTLLHDDNYGTKEHKAEEIRLDVKTENEANKQDNTVCTHAQSKLVRSVLSTAMVLVKDYRGRYLEGTPLLGNGSQSNYVTEEFVKRLNVRAKDSQIQIKAISGHVSHALKAVDLNVTSRFDTFGTSLSCIVLPEITQRLPTVEIDRTNLKLPTNRH